MTAAADAENASRAGRPLRPSERARNVARRQSDEAATTSGEPENGAPVGEHRAPEVTPYRDLPAATPAPSERAHEPTVEEAPSATPPAAPPQAGAAPLPGRPRAVTPPVAEKVVTPEPPKSEPPKGEPGNRVGGNEPPPTRRRDEFEKMPKRRRGCTVIAALLVVFVLLIAVVPGVIYFMYQSAGGDDPGTGSVPFTVAPGQGVSEIAQNLESAGVIRSAQSFRIYVRVRNLKPVIQAGDYELREGMGAGAVIAVLSKGPIQRYRPLTLPPGLTLADQAKRVGDQLGMSPAEFTTAVSNQAPKLLFPEAGNGEGLCFPETYRVENEMAEDDVAELCLRQFQKVFDGISHSRLGELKVTPYQAVIIASLVESESKVPEERPIIASVIYNRLKQGMPLQIDATVLYALGQHKERVLLEDLKVDSPYNTYKIKGLPPTPISAPGKASLEAALNPAQTNYLYYVLTDSSGRHAFADNAKEFERLKADAIRRGVY